MQLNLLFLGFSVKLEAVGFKVGRLLESTLVILGFSSLYQKNVQGSHKKPDTGVVSSEVKF